MACLRHNRQGKQLDDRDLRERPAGVVERDPLADAGALREPVLILNDGAIVTDRLPR